MESLMFKDRRMHGAAELSLLVGDVIYADSIRGKGQTSYGFMIRQSWRIRWLLLACSMLRLGLIVRISSVYPPYIVRKKYVDDTTVP